jgi:hypothetical protein
MAIVINSKTKLTYDDYVLLPDDGKILEFIDGVHYIDEVCDQALELVVVDLSRIW